jgi:hypothetical protein
VPSALLIDSARPDLLEDGSPVARESYTMAPLSMALFQTEDPLP